MRIQVIGVAQAINKIVTEKSKSDVFTPEDQKVKNFG